MPQSSEPRQPTSCRLGAPPAVVKCLSPQKPRALCQMRFMFFFQQGKRGFVFFCILWVFLVFLFGQKGTWLQAQADAQLRFVKAHWRQCERFLKARRSGLCSPSRGEAPEQVCPRFLLLDGCQDSRVILGTLRLTCPVGSAPGPGAHPPAAWVVAAQDAGCSHPCRRPGSLGNSSVWPSFLRIPTIWVRSFQLVFSVDEMVLCAIYFMSS